MIETDSCRLAGEGGHWSAVYYPIQKPKEVIDNGGRENRFEDRNHL